MKSKWVQQWSCGFCKKRGLSASSMSKHEKHCSNNPNRECRMCGHLGLNQQPMDKLKAVLKRIANRHPDDYAANFDNCDRFIEPCLQALRELTGGCPICMISALRQSGVPGWMSGLDFDEEVRRAWAEAKNNQP